MTDYRGLLKHSLCVAEGEHPGFNKTTETQSSQRKALPFYGEKEIKVRLEIWQCLLMIVSYCKFEDLELELMLYYCEIDEIEENYSRKK